MPPEGLNWQRKIPTQLEPKSISKSVFEVWSMNTHDEIKPKQEEETNPRREKNYSTIKYPNIAWLELIWTNFSKFLVVDQFDSEKLPSITSDGRVSRGSMDLIAHWGLDEQRPKTRRIIHLLIERNPFAM